MREPAAGVGFFQEGGARGTAQPVACLLRTSKELPEAHVEPSSLPSQMTEPQFKFLLGRKVKLNPNCMPTQHVQEQSWEA